MRVTSKTLRHDYARRVQLLAQSLGLACLRVNEHETPFNHAAVRLRVSGHGVTASILFDGNDMSDQARIHFDQDRPVARFAGRMGWTVDSFRGFHAVATATTIEGVLSQLSSKFAAIRHGSAYEHSQDTLLIEC